MDDLVSGIIDANSLSSVGGKAFALGEMSRAGFNVPGGFVLSARTFMTMTPSLQRLILRSFEALPAELVAVRSSAINEDGQEAAWAGQLDTFLNCNRDNLLQSIQDCWESANSERAQSYARQRALQSTKVAVIVQEMIQSEISGIAFSVHPVSNDDTLVVIEAGLGLGEAIVSGQITPDTYVVIKETGLPIEKHLAQQQKKLVRSAVGKTTWKAAGPQGNKQKLSDEQITELCQLTAQLEAFFAYPVDAEWAIRDNVLYVLQCRPITTLLPS